MIFRQAFASVLDVLLDVLLVLNNVVLADAVLLDVLLDAVLFADDVLLEDVLLEVLDVLLDEADRSHRSLGKKILSTQGGGAACSQAAAA